MTTPDTVLFRLRAATHEAHQALEDQLDVMGRLGSAADRGQLVARYHRMYAGAASLLAEWLDAEENCRFLNGWLPQTRPRDSPAASALPEGRDDHAHAAIRIRSRAEALGFRYVIDGSALGGRVILRRLAALGVDTAELGFLDPYGAGIGAVWRSLMDVLERELAGFPPSVDEAIAGAMKGFAYARRCLGDEVLPV